MREGGVDTAHLPSGYIDPQVARERDNVDCAQPGIEKGKHDDISAEARTGAVIAAHDQDRDQVIRFDQFGCPRGTGVILDFRCGCDGRCWTEAWGG